MNQFAQEDETQILDFYNRDQTIPGEFSRLRHIMEWPDEKWEECHTFIQWVFPTNEASQFNPNAPILNVHAARWICKRALLKSFDRFLKFLGFDWNEDMNDYKPRYGRVAKWYQPGNHNLLRVTRVLKCMMLCGCYMQARELEILLHRTRSYARYNGWEEVPQETWDYWNGSLMYNGRVQSEFDEIKP